MTEVIFVDKKHSKNSDDGQSFFLELNSGFFIIISSFLPNREPRHEKKHFCICENKGADQLHGYCAADKHLCFRYIDSKILLLP